MKILQVHNFYQIPGGEDAVVSAEKALLEQHGHEVKRFSKDSSEINALSLCGKTISALRIPHNSKIDKELLSFARREKPDVAHVHNVFPLLSPSVYSALFNAEIPIVQTHHNYRLFCPNGLLFDGAGICEDCRKGFSRSIRKKCVRKSKSLSFLYAFAIWRAWRKGLVQRNITSHIAPSGFLRDKLISRGIAKDSVAVCGNFVFDFEDSVSQKEDYVLFLGRLSPEKGLFNLFAAMKQVDVRLLVAGAGPLKAALEAYASQHLLEGKVEFLGFLDEKNKKKILKKAKALILPSECHETFGIVAAEALAQATPVIASRLGGLPDLVDHGENGFLFTPGDSRQLAELINIISQTPGLSESMGEKALARAKKTLGPETHHRHLIEIYRDAINKIKSSQT